MEAPLDEDASSKLSRLLAARRRLKEDNVPTLVCPGVYLGGLACANSVGLFPSPWTGSFGPGMLAPLRSRLPLP